ncbi:gliding motility-associated C-terminal domain-containing protein [Maribacter dokdonensis]|uniref:Gliding motility-associated C-terminal domain-containing protein n=2 Tax=Maribacter dokdonensis TaxID=320912 RepID=A0A1H4JEJ6_9FLAO|nr:gliding motility-associated C-terminal domain-containing protein [Maribacter dokdonensis]SEB43982.1 gliding motility-associated C-terminal domain-containing protein [Maribacter dokdonensis]
MKNIGFLFFFLCTAIVSAQSALYNNGNLRIHNGGSIGFHTNFINESPMDNNLGLAGFYGSERITVSGTVTPQFYDMELALENDMQLDLGVDNISNTNFIFGNIHTNLSQPNIFYNFVDNSFYNGENDFSKIEGYAAITNQQEFGFPIGDNEYLRPLILISESVNLFAKSAYFYEDANNPVSLANTYNTATKAFDVELVSTAEFWQLEGTVPSTVSLSWNLRSNLSRLTNDVSMIIPVGWSKAQQQWVNLSRSAPVGTITEGFITTRSILPDEFEIITFGTSKEPYEPLAKDVLFIDNFFVSVNGDGVNDTFYIEELEEFNSNFVQIYDRYGLKVFEKTNYTNEFVGFSNLDNVPFGAEEGLPTGVYFYTIHIPDEDLNYQGFLYLTR